ncbi:hypothetical protein CLPUN_41830 [Clostridium puniceum]|uniref:Uncharacterized protein n=1 Tax=Clostridium puniceum TaxID=29367 RepID=A0A1S8T8G4_9CLOT|nr:hypothetical protein [Clostridium puniceum]OOM74043.1 hypothetical protein CLPUN_41830 [Clostridium puniceum]
MKNKEISLEEIMKEADLASGLDLDMLIEEYVYEDEDIELKAEPKKKTEKERETDEGKGHGCHVPPVKISCDLEVAFGRKNKIIYVNSGKLQYFTAFAKKCCGDETIEIEYCGDNIKCICGEAVIRGSLGYYKIVKSGIIFIPRRNLSEIPDEWFPTDILCFKAKSKCDKDVKFDVIFTYSRSVDRRCKCH